MNGLRRESDMPHNGDTGGSDGADCICTLAPAFELDRIHAALL